MISEYSPEPNSCYRNIADSLNMAPLKIERVNKYGQSNLSVNVFDNMAPVLNQAK